MKKPIYKCLYGEGWDYCYFLGNYNKDSYYLLASGKSFYIDRVNKDSPTANSNVRAEQYLPIFLITDTYQSSEVSQSIEFNYIEYYKEALKVAEKIFILM